MLAFARAQGYLHIFAEDNRTGNLILVVSKFLRAMKAIHMGNYTCLAKDLQFTRFTDLCYRRNESLVTFFVNGESLVTGRNTLGNPAKRNSGILVCRAV